MGFVHPGSDLLPGSTLSMDTSALLSHSPVGYFITASKSDASSAHSLCGDQSIRGAISPNSGLPLLLVASLDLTDPRLGITDPRLKTLHLLYSWTCPISDGEFTYRETDSGIQVLKYTAGPPHKDFPYDKYPPSFPRITAQLQQVDQHEQSIIRALNRRENDPILLEEQFPQLATPRSQVGGEPRLMQWPLPQRTCPECGEAMPLLAAIGDENGTSRGFSGNPFVQLLYFFCVPCGAVTTYNITD